MQFTLSESDERTVKSKASDASTVTPGGTAKKKKAVDTEKSLHERDLKILAKKQFGPYKVGELIKFLQTFQSIESEVKTEDDDISFVPASINSEETEETKDAGGFRMNNYYASKDGDDDDDDDDWPTDEESDTEKAIPPEVEMVEVSTEEVQAERELQEMEAHKKKLAEIERDLEAKHAISVVTSNIRLLPFMNTKFMRLNNSYKHELTKLMSKRAEDGTLPRNVVINLTDALTFCCPYMEASERNLCLRYFVLKTPRSIEFEETTEKGMTREQLAKLKQMFEFFDKDGSGGIDKFEIVEVLEKLAANTKNDATADKVDDCEEMGSRLEDAELLIASVQGHDAEELDFESFVKMFKNMV